MLRKRQKTRNVILVVFLILLSGCGLAFEQQTAPSDSIFPHQWLGNIDKVGLNEPSGICFHSQRGTLFVVGDEGYVYEIETDGHLVKQTRFGNADFEGITHDRTSGFLYIVVEGENLVIELNPERFEVLREFQIPRVLEGEKSFRQTGQGLEAITFVPDANHAEGGTFFIVNQNFTVANRTYVSGVFELELPLKNKGKQLSKGKIVSYFAPEATDLSGLYYDHATDHLFAISDAENKLFEFDRSGTLLSEYAFPGKHQEGITVDDNGYLYIAQDSGGIIKVLWERNQKK